MPKFDGATVNEGDFLDHHDRHATSGGRSHGGIWIDAREFHLEITAAKPDRVVIGDAVVSKEVMSYDAAATENAYASIPVPNDYGGEGELVFQCTADATANDAVTNGSVASKGRGAAALAAGTAFGDLVTTVPGTARLFFDIIVVLPAAVVPKPGETLQIMFSRIGGDGSDTLAAELELHGVWFRYRRA